MPKPHSPSAVAADAEDRKPSPAVLFSVAVLALALNQSGRILGLNLSLADPVLLFAMLTLLVDRRIQLPGRAIGFFVLLSVVTVSTALLITPELFGVIPAESDILLDFAKLLTSLLFLIFGYNVAAHGLAFHAVRCFAVGAAAVALFGILLSVFNIHSFDGALYYGFARYRGLMIDPNYYAILTCAAIAYFIRDRTLWWVARIAALGVLLYSLVASGSKTGTVALLVLFGVLIFDAARRSKYSLLLVTALIAVAFFIIAIWDEVGELVQGLASRYGGTVPQLYRIADLFNGPLDAASTGGSDRFNVWSRGIDIIQASPLLGSGIGSYGNVVEATSGIGTLAHNTYIQVAAEWGLPLALVLFAWIASLVITATSSSVGGDVGRDVVLLRDVIVVFLVGSVSLSLNNARMFWFFLGILAFIATRMRKKAISPAAHIERTAMS